MYDCKKVVLYTLLTLLGVELVSETIMVGFIGSRLKSTFSRAASLSSIDKQSV